MPSARRCTTAWIAGISSAYLHDGILEIDNNLIENAIRPLALGRKNYLFAGSHEAAKRAAAIYSFFAMCKKEEVNPFEWLKHVFENIMDTKTSSSIRSTRSTSSNYARCSWWGGYGSTEGKFVRTMGMLAIGAGLGAVLAGPISGAIGSTGLSLLDTYWLDSILKGNDPSIFIDGIKDRIWEKENKVS